MSPSENEWYKYPKRANKNGIKLLTCNNFLCYLIRKGINHTYNMRKKDFSRVNRSHFKKKIQMLGVSSERIIPFHWFRSKTENQRARFCGILSNKTWIEDSDWDWSELERVGPRFRLVTRRKEIDWSPKFFETKSLRNPFACQNNSIVESSQSQAVAV